MRAGTELCAGAQFGPGTRSFVPCGATSFPDRVVTADAQGTPPRPPRGQIRRGAFLVVGLLVLAGAGALAYQHWKGRHAEADLWFADVTDEVNLDFVHDPGDENSWFMPQIHGSGVAVFDF